MNELITQIDAGMHGVGDALPQASTTAFPEDWFFESVTWGRSDSGETVNPNTALSHGPVWQAINILTGDVGQLPWHKMRKLANGGAERDPEHPVEWLISEEPNPWQTPSVWLETMMSWALAWGNGISALMRNRRGERWFLPLSPDRTGYVEDEEDGYLITSEVAGRRVALLPSEVFHIRGLTSNGFWGLSAVSVCKNVIGHGLALQRHGNSVFKNHARPAGALTMQGKLTPEQRTEYRAEWNKLHSGAENVGNVAILWGGMTWAPMSMSNDDAQWIEGRRLDRELVASLFNLPAFKLNALENSAVRANLEEQNRDYFNTSLSRWLNRFNEEAKRKLLSTAERRSRVHFFRWFPEAFLRGDIQKRYAAYSQAITARFMNPNEVRAKEDMNPYEGGDEFANPAIDVRQQGEPAENPKREEGEDTNVPDEKAAALSRSLVQSQVAALLDVEANRIERTARTARNFVDSASDFYEKYTVLAEKYLEIPAEVARNSGFPQANWRSATGLHARDSLQRLLAMTDLVTKDGLAEAAAQFAGDVRMNLERLTAAVLGGSQDA